MDNDNTSTATEETQEQTTQNFLDMSDEDFDNLETPDFDALNESDSESETEDETEDETENTDLDSATEDDSEETDEDEETEVENEITEKNSETTEEEVKEKDDVDFIDNDIAEIDYKAEYEKLLTPFRANNKDIKINNVDEAIKLMQMGANYNKKMGALKPNLKLMKMLDNNDLLNESKLSYLIDLSKHDKSAVAKLVKESGLDLLETEDSPEYKPNTYTVGDNEVELQQTLEDIQDTDAYSTTVDIISNKWDDSSRQVIAQNPSVIRFLNDHVTTGIYSKVMGEVDKQRMLGELAGLSDIEAYKQVGDIMQARGDFGRPTETQPATVRKKATVTGSLDQKTKAKKKAATSTRSTPAKSKQVPDFNPLALSDDELDKIDISKYL